MNTTVFNLVCDGGVIIIGVAASLLINVWYKKLQSRALLSYIPNIWTSLGILGTFVAIVYSLTWGDIKTNGEIDVTKVIAYIIPAFVTSIIGIVGAITASMLIKRRFAQDDYNYDVNNRRKIREDITPEQTLYQLLTYTRDSNKEIKGITQKITEGILEEVNKALSEKLVAIADTHAAALEDIFAKEKETLNEQCNAIITSFERTADSFAQTLADYQKKQADHIKNMGEQTVSSLNDVSSDVRSSSEAMVTQFKTSIEDIKTKTIAAIESGMETQAQGIISMVKDTTETLINKIKDMQADVVKASTSTQQSIIDGIKAQTKEAVDAFKEGIGEQTAALDKLTKEYIEKVSDLAKEFGVNTQSTQTILDSLLEQMKTNAGNDVATISAAMSSTVQESAEKLKSGIDENITTLNGLTGNLSKTLTPLVASIGTSYKDYAKTFKSAENILKKLEDAESKLSAILSTFNTDSEDVKKVYESLLNISEQNRTLNYRLNELRLAYEASGKPLPEKCPHCGAEVSDPAARYCGKCGGSLFDEKQD